MRPIVVVLVAWSALASCGGQGGTPAASSSAARVEPSSSQHEAASEVSEPGAQPEAEVAAPPPRVPEGPPPRVVIRGAQERDGRAVAITVVNHDASEARIAPGVRVEREVQGTWSALAEVGAIALRMDCEHEAAECVALVPGAELHPPAWLGTIGDAQCACERCVPAEPGRYRFVIESCEGHRLEGEPFEITAR